LDLTFFNKWHSYIIICKNLFYKIHFKTIIINLRRTTRQNKMQDENFLFLCLLGCYTVWKRPWCCGFSHHSGVGSRGTSSSWGTGRWKWRWRWEQRCSGKKQGNIHIDITWMFRRNQDFIWKLASDMSNSCNLCNTVKSFYLVVWWWWTCSWTLKFVDFQKKQHNY